MKPKTHKVLDRRELPLACFGLLFGGRPFSWRGKTYTKPEETIKKGLPYVKIGDWMYIIQNPNTQSKWSKMAREGKKVMWIIRTTDDKYVGRMVEGVLTKL